MTGIPPYIQLVLDIAATYIKAISSDRRKVIGFNDEKSEYSWLRLFHNRYHVVYVA